MPSFTVKVVIHPNEGLIEKHFADGISRMVPGSITKKGYMRTRYGGRMAMVHRVIWEHVHGAIPMGQEIDHINGIRTDNRIANLRLVTRSQNNQNQHHAQPTSKSGVKGVCWDNTRGNWRATIQYNRVHYSLGRFTTIEDAQCAYAGAAALIHTHNPHAAP